MINTTAHYFNDKSHKCRQGNFFTIVYVISDEYKTVFKNSIETKSEYEAVAVLAQDRDEWKDIVLHVIHK